jgi:hypothetical protein
LGIPDLAQGDFEHLTISGQLRVIEDLIQGERCRLVGSSMGGYLAALYAAEHSEVERVVLLAPAFGFATRWREMQSPSIERRNETNWLEVYHYGDKAMRRVHYELIEDASHFPDYPDFTQSALIFHGVNDTVVPIDYSRRFADFHPNTFLRELDSDHELLDVLPAITEEAIRFLTETR